MDYYDWVSKAPRHALPPLKKASIIAYYNSQRGKTLDQIWEEDINAACGNMLKHAQTDSGGAEAFVSLAERCLKIAAKAFANDGKTKKSAIKALADEIYRFSDQRHKAIRMSQIKRIAMIKVKSAGGSKNDYFRELTRMANQTLLNKDKNTKVISISDDSLYHQIKKCG